MGFQADAILWDLESRTMLHRLRLHKVKVQALSFSCNELYLASLGGPDDNNLVIWDIETGKAVCGSPASNDSAFALSFVNNSDFTLVTAGNYNLRVWDFDRPNRKVRPTDVNVGQLRRIVNCLKVDPNDEFCYCGTTTGDILQVSIPRKLFKNVGPKARFSLGVQSLQMTPSGELLAGCGDGTVVTMKPENFKVQRSTAVQGSVTSIAVRGGDYFFVGTATSNTYVVKLEGLVAELRSTCHYDGIADIAFPADYSEVFATCSRNDIRVWNSRSCIELLRIQVPNLTCTCITFSMDGKSIISGWSDGKIRAFGPQSGKLLYVINDAHQGGVTAIACTNDNEHLVSGGMDGQVRVWRVSKQSRVMIASMKEHKATINCIQVRNNDSESVSASSDGSCIIWDMNRFVRNNSLFASTFFKSILYHPDESQLLTTGSDRKITYWDAYDGSAIRILDGSQTAELNSLAISASGDLFVSGGADKVVRVWSYDDGIANYKGIGHSGAINRVKISPDQQTIISVGSEGAIMMWRCPPVVGSAS
jgi:WD40 repeat protein